MPALVALTQALTIQSQIVQYIICLNYYFAAFTNSPKDYT